MNATTNLSKVIGDKIITKKQKPKKKVSNAFIFYRKRNTNRI